MISTRPPAAKTVRRLTPAQQELANRWIALARKKANAYVQKGKGLGLVLDRDAFESAAMMAVTVMAGRFRPDHPTAKSPGTLLDYCLRQHFHRELCKARGGGLGQITNGLVKGRMPFDAAPQFMSSETPIACGTLADLLHAREPADPGPDPEAVARLYEGILRLRPREAAVIVWRFFQGWTLDQCAQKLGLCRERVRQLEGEAKTALWHYLKNPAAPPPTIPCSACGTPIQPSASQVARHANGLTVCCQRACGRKFGRGQPGLGAG